VNTLSYLSAQTEVDVRGCGRERRVVIRARCASEGLARGNQHFR